jgi:hypothetical protein
MSPHDKTVGHSGIFSDDCWKLQWTASYCIRYAELHDGYVQVSLQLERPTAPMEGEILVFLVTEQYPLESPAFRTVIATLNQSRLARSSGRCWQGRSCCTPLTLVCPRHLTSSHREENVFPFTGEKKRRDWAKVFIQTVYD